jgi:hypothetical protein
MHVLYANVCNTAMAMPSQASVYASASCHRGYTAPSIGCMTQILLCWKRDHLIKDNAFNVMCKTKHRVELRAGNSHPPSLYVCKVVLGVNSVAEYERHMCVKECAAFVRSPSDLWILHKDEKCPKCKEWRFEEYQTQAGPKVRARKYFYDFGLAEVVQELHNDPEFCQLRRTSQRGQDRLLFWKVC